MSLRKYRPITPGTRFRVGNAYEEVTTSTPEKSLLAPMRRTGGRNHDGKMTTRNIGGGHKKRYRVIDFKRDKDGIEGRVATIEYDPNRSAYIALIVYRDGEKRYIIAPRSVKVGDVLMSGAKALPNAGNTLFLSDIPQGSVIYNIEIRPGNGGVIARSAGSYCVLMGREGKYATVKMPSGEVRKILVACRATMGTASNPDHNLQVLGKAGRKRWLGRRPRVRGVAMNPVDHPMGGGEGRASGGHPRSRTGIMAKGQKTRDPNKYSNRLIVTKKKKKTKK